MRGTRRSFTVTSARATADTTIQVLGQSGEIMEYKRDIDVAPHFNQTDSGLELDVMPYQRIYNMEQPPWPNPIVVKLTHVEPVGESTELDAANEGMQHVRGEDRG